NLLYHAFKEVCLEIYPIWDHKILTIASSSDEKKMFFHISTFDLQEKDIINNITNKSLFSLQMLNTLKIIEKKCNESSKTLYKYIHSKRAIFLKDSSVFDFILYLSNDEAPVIDSPLLDILKEKLSIGDGKILEKNRVEDPLQGNKINARIIRSEVEYIEKLLKEYKIEAESQYLLCNQEHTSDNVYII
ncbi:11385_t:CDS:2, partial [Scutellospora calospora]